MSAPPLILLHGWGFSSQVWRPLMTALHTRGVEQVYPVDLPGFGSAYHEPVKSLTHVLDYLTDIVSGNAVLCGWSLGGMIATQLAARHPQHVSGLITIASNLHFTATENWPGMPGDDFRQFCDRFMQQPEKTWRRFLQLQTRGDSAATNADQRLAVLADFSTIEILAAEKMLDLLGQIDNRTVFPTLPMPGLHFFGEADAITPIAVGRHLQTLNSAQHCVMLDRAGHALPVSRAEDMAEAIQQFMAGLATS